MRIEEVQAFTKSCINGEPAICSGACPLKMDIRAFLEAVQAQKWRVAYRMMRDAMIFPDIVARLCPHSCETSCVRNRTDEAVAIGAIEMAVLRHVKSKEAKRYSISQKPQRIAVIGSGLSGLACAYKLAIKKYQVTVYDKNDRWGGALLSRPELEEYLCDIPQQLSNEKITFCFGQKITDLSELNCDAIYIATGSPDADFGLGDGWDAAALTTGQQGVYMGGGCCGKDPLQALTDGILASTQIEKYLQTGNMPQTGKEDQSCSGYQYATQFPARPRVPTGTAGYTAEEASEEAKRCLMCDCTQCIDQCEMLRAFRKKPQRAAYEIFNDSMVMPNISKRTMTRQIGSCNLCDHCSGVCPTEVDIGAAMLFARRDRVKNGNYPKVFHDFWLRQMDFSVHEASIEIPPVQGPQKQYVFFPGCQLGASDPRYVLAAYSVLREKLGAGLIVSCCGAPAYWAGDEDLYQQTLSQMKRKWEEWDKPVMIFACASCEKLWRQEMDGAEYTSLYQLLDSACCAVSPLAEAAVFDPCAARDDSLMRSSVRTLAQKCGTQIHELPFHDEQAKCCGWGGHIQVANRSLYDQIVENRITADENPYVVYCANCRDSFGARGKQAAHILDLYFGLDNGTRPAPTIKKKRDNSLTLKQQLSRTYLNQEFIIDAKKGDTLNLTIPAQLIDKMERQLISEDDIRAAIAAGNQSGQKIFDPDANLYYSSVTLGETTIWVGYREADEIEVCTVYSHRMKVLE